MAETQSSVARIVRRLECRVAGSGTRRTTACIRFVALGLFLVVLAACAAPPQLSPPPNVLRTLADYPDTQLPAHLRTTTPAIFYVTDRTRISPDGAPVDYGFSRSRSMAFGFETVSFGEGLSWEELKARSVAEGNHTTRLASLSTTELVRFPPTPVPFRIDGTVPIEEPAARVQYNRAAQEFKARVAAELARANRPEILLYVHGVRNEFEASVETMANIWHFSGRIGVPVVFAWPAGAPGVFGYFTDRESAEFSVFHFKETIRLLAEIPGLRKIHIIAHSRGTDLATTGLRELLIAERAAGRDPRKTLKVDNLILAAADLNVQVVGQRLVSEHFAVAFNQITIYLNGRDTALGLAQSLMRGQRLGRLTLGDQSSEELQVLANLRRVHFINVETVIGGGSHSYFRQNPDVMSDIILTLRTSAPPGGDVRPLERVQGNFWNLHKGYPFGRPKAVFADPRGMLDP